MATSTAGRLTQALRKSHAMGPSVRNLINQYKLDPNQISSTGPHQTLLKGDVLSYLSNNQSGHQASSQAAAVGAAAAAVAPGSKTDTSILSAPRPSHYQMGSSANKRYPRRMLTELEIEVINSGGLIELPALKQDASKAKKR